MPRERLDRLPPQEAPPPQEGKERLAHASFAFVFPGQGSQGRNGS